MSNQTAAMAGSEMLAEPLASTSRSVPFELLFASISSEIEESPEVASAADKGGGSEARSRTKSRDTPIEVPSAPDSLHSIQSQAFSGTRRFVSSPSEESQKPAEAEIASQVYPRRVSLSRWYKRLPSKPSTTNSRPRRATSGSGRLRWGTSSGSSSALRAHSLPQRFSDDENTIRLSEEIVRLRAALRSEKHARRLAEAKVTSLKNALQSSQRHVDGLEQRRLELNAQLTDTRAAIAPMHEILAISERHFHRKELALQRIIEAQQVAEGHRQAKR